MALAARLRGHNTKVDVILTDKKLGDKMTYAAKVANKGIVVGESEVASGNLKIKDFSTGEVSNF
jgi:histidyl-tRNA synthetase